MRQKELRIALVCYGGVSLAVYMHGVTKELWKLTRASQCFHAGGCNATGSEAVYLRLLEHIAAERDLRLRVLPDIISGASAGGINGIFLAQAIYSGQSLEPLTQLWLDRADVDVLTDPDARPWWRFAKFWAMPLVWLALTRPGNVVSESVARETRSEVRTKLSRLIRSRWFEPPFGGLGFSRLLAEALDAMARSDCGAPLLPPNHPLDLFVTATDFKGHPELLRLNSPPLAHESEHRLSIGFRATTPGAPGQDLASPFELVFAARATASFPGAFPPLQLREIDELAAEREQSWSTRTAFANRVMPEHRRSGDIEAVSLIDGSVLVNAPFADAIGVLRKRPAQREVDRRFVYIDPSPDRIGSKSREDSRLPGFFSVILGSLSSIPREQPIRDNLEQLSADSREMARLRGIVRALRPEVEEAVDHLFGRTLFLDRPSIRRLSHWRAKAQQAAAERAGFAFNGYAQLKYAGVLDALATIVHRLAPELGLATPEPIARHLTVHLDAQGLERLTSAKGGATPEAIAFFRAHDLAFRIRRLRLLARRLTQEWDRADDVTESALEEARDAVFHALSLYLGREADEMLDGDMPALAERVFEDPAAALEGIARRRNLCETDELVDAMLASAMAAMPPVLRRRVLLTYLGFPFYDTITLPLLRGRELNEFDPVKVDRISPDDAKSIRPGGTRATLRGVEFYNFGAFFSRAYRENDYLWGRLHGAERMIDLVASTLPDTDALSAEDLQRFKQEVFLAILDEEAERLVAEPDLVPGIRAEVLAR